MIRGAEAEPRELWARVEQHLSRDELSLALEPLIEVFRASASHPDRDRARLLVSYCLVKKISATLRKVRRLELPFRSVPDTSAASLIRYLGSVQAIFAQIGCDPGLALVEAVRRDHELSPGAPENADAISEELLNGFDLDGVADGPWTPMARTTLRIAWRSSRYTGALSRVLRFARSSQSILISGESGVGKTAFAEVVHFAGGRARHPFVAVNCAALPESLLESELFGHVRGAFTGAHADKVGLIRAAGHGTVFLDEIDKASPPAQAALLQVLDRHEVRAVGGSASHRVRARFVFATSRDLTALAQRGDFLPDLTFRIRGLGAIVPPLRERAEDFDLLLAVALRELRCEEGWDRHVSREARDLLLTYDWPGNVRELFRTVQAAAHLVDEGGEIGVREIELAASASRLEAHADRVRQKTDLTARVREFERQEILLALRLEGGNQTSAARRLGLSRRGLNKKLHRHELLDQLEREGLRTFRCRRSGAASPTSSR